MRREVMQAKLKSNSRSKSGLVMLLVMIGAFMILLPLGLFGFEVARLNMASKQLKAATDSAVLAAASYMSNTSGGAESFEAGRKLALDFFKKNVVMSVMLSNSNLSPSVDSDAPASGMGSFDLVIDEATGKITAKGAFGLEPAFARFLGLNAVPIHTHSVAGFSGMEGDICMVVDISDSMTAASKSMTTQRIYNATSNKVTYKIVNRNSSALPTLGRRGATSAVPRLELANWSSSAHFRSIANMSDDIKLAALIEAKRGNLESPAKFAESHANAGILNGVINPEPGWRRDYQLLAMAHVNPLADEKVALSEFISGLEGSNAHLSLVTFGGRSSSGPDTKDDFSTFGNHHYPHVALSKSEDKRQLVIDSLAPCLSFLWTDTKGGLREGVKILEGTEHRPEVPKTIILLTDGVPTTGSPKNVAKLAGQKGIRIFAVGFFQTARAKKDGPKTLRTIVAACGNGSKMYLAPDIPTLKDVLKQIGNGTVALTND